MDAIKVYINKQTDGIAFSLSPTARKAISREFPNALPTGSVFVNYDTKFDFETYHGKIEKYIVPMLLGLGDEDMKKLGKIQFLDPINNAVLYSYPNE